MKHRIWLVPMTMALMLSACPAFAETGSVSRIAEITETPQVIESGSTISMSEEAAAAIASASLPADPESVAEAEEPESVAEEAEAAQPAAALADLAGGPAEIGSSASGDAFFSWEGFRVELTGYDLFKSPGSTPTLNVFGHVINDTDRNLSLWFRDTNINGTSVLATGFLLNGPHSDSSDDPDTSAMIFPSTSNAEEGTEAILSADRINTTLVLVDSDTKEELAMKEAVIRLSELSGERTVLTPIPTPEPTPSYRMLSKGDSGEDVRKLQEALISLGYLMDAADGKFGAKTAAAVKEFNEANGLGSGESATVSAQQLIFSGMAKAYTEPWIPLEIGDYFQWRDGLDNTFSFFVEVTNKSRSRTIRGYELTLYATDIWGEKVYGDVKYTFTEPITVEPGQTRYCNSLGFTRRYSVHTMWVAISKIAFSDGEVREPSVLSYVACEMPYK